jgi:aspartate--ammonia ligase
MAYDKKADLAAPGIGDYAELEKILPQDYESPLTPKETQKAIFAPVMLNLISRRQRYS